MEYFDYVKQLFEDYTEYKNTVSPITMEKYLTDVLNYPKDEAEKIYADIIQIFDVV